MGRRLTLAFSLIALLIAAPAKTEEPAITVRLTPQTGFEPLTVEVYMRIQPNYLNYMLCLDWDKAEWEDLGQLGCWSLDGEYAAPSQYYTLKSLPAGEYHVRARLRQVHRDVYTALQTIHIIETPFRPQP